MKALTIVEPGKAAYTQLDMPAIGDSEVLLKIERVGYCGSDLNTYRGLNPLVSYPRVPGHEIQGRIAKIGRRVVSEFEIGQLVTALPYTNCGICSACRVGRINACKHNQTLGVQREGALTEFIAIPHEKVLAAPGLEPQAFALIEPLAVGFHAVDRGRVTRNDTVLIFGCGMIGLGAIAGAGLDRGATVIAVDLDDHKLALARKAGADEIINASHEDLHARLQTLTDGYGPSVAIEAVGLPQTFLGCVDEVGYAGRVVYIGYAREPVSYQTKLFVLKELDILGSRGSTQTDFERVIAMLEAGCYPVNETITETVPFDHASEALARWDNAPGKITKIHVTLND